MCDIICKCIRYAYKHLALLWHPLLFYKGLFGCLPANVPISEEELPAEIALFNDIIIGDCDLTLSTNSKTHHGKVFDEFTTQSTSTNQKYLQKQAQSLCLQMQIPVHPFNVMNTSNIEKQHGLSLARPLHKLVQKMTAVAWPQNLTNVMLAANHLYEQDV